jgi:hypothetical protein
MPLGTPSAQARLGGCKSHIESSSSSGSDAVTITDFRNAHCGCHDANTTVILRPFVSPSVDAGPIRIGAETLESVPCVMRDSDNDDEGNETKTLHPSKIVLA